MRIHADEVLVALPPAIDDEYITPAGVYPQPATLPSVLAGFYFVSRFFCLLGQVITARRAADRALPSSSELSPTTASPRSITSPHGSTVNGASLPSARIFTDELDSILSELPQVLQAGEDSDGRIYLAASTSTDGPGSSDRSKEAMFATCRANLLVTQALLRLTITRYAAALASRTQDSSVTGVEVVESREGSSLVKVLNSLKSCVSFDLHNPS